jgi:hypothetical protein
MGNVLTALKKFIEGGSSVADSPMDQIHTFLNNKSVLRSTHFIVNCGFCQPWEIEDYSITLPNADTETVGYLANQYSFPVIKGGEAIKLTLTIADNENMSIYRSLFKIKSNILASNGLYNTPDTIKNNHFNIMIYTPSGEIITTLRLSNCFLVSLDDLKYSYASMTDYQKYSVTFVCDPVDFTYS